MFIALLNTSQKTHCLNYEDKLLREESSGNIYVIYLYVICDLNWSLRLATDYAKQVERNISQTPVGWDSRDAFGADRRI